MPGHRVEAIANEFLRLAKAEGRSLTNMQLQKLPYIAHGWWLALADLELVDESPTTFPYGPVYRRLNNALKRYGSGNVTDFIRDNDGTPAEILGAPRGDVIAVTLAPEETRLIEAVWNAYKNYHAFQLSGMTHREGSPWTVTTQKSGPYKVISNDLIRQYYKGLATTRRQAVAQG
jgi:uncharacterized phage-associated protein